MKREQAGFTLLEILVAVFLVGIGLLSVAPMFVYVTKSTASSADLGTVGAAAVQRMEVIRSIPFSDLAAGGSLTTNNTGFVDTSAPDFVVRWTVTNNATPATRKTIVVRALATRRAVGLQKEIVLTTVRSR